MTHPTEIDFETEASVLAGLILALDILHCHNGEGRQLAIDAVMMVASDRAMAAAGTEVSR